MTLSSELDFDELMESLAAFLMIADFLLAIFFVGLFHWLYIIEKISLAYLYAFWFGTLIGSTWEFTFLFLGPEFLHGAVELSLIHI